MGENRIVTEFFFERPAFEEVSKVARSLEEAGVKVMLLPPEDRGINTHLIVESADVEKANEVLKRLGLSVKEKEALLIKLENRPGTMAEAAQKIAEKGVNLKYAFSVAIDPTKSYILLGAEDNKAALEALSS